MLDLKPQTHCSKNKRLVWFNVGWISARNQATENSSKATIRDTLRAIQLFWLLFFWTVQCVQLQALCIYINMQVWHCDGLWTQLTGEAGGEQRVSSRWPETADWPVCDPQYIPSYGLLVRALVFCWAGTYRLTCLHNTAQIHYFRPRGTKWPLPSGELHQIPSQHDKSNTLATDFNTLIMIDSRGHRTEEISRNISIDRVWQIRIVGINRWNALESPQKSIKYLCVAHERIKGTVWLGAKSNWHHPLPNSSSPDLPLQ